MKFALNFVSVVLFLSPCPSRSETIDPERCNLPSDSIAFVHVKGLALVCSDAKKFKKDEVYEVFRADLKVGSVKMQKGSKTETVVIILEGHLKRGDRVHLEKK